MKKFLFLFIFPLIVGCINQNEPEIQEEPSLEYLHHRSENSNIILSQPIEGYRPNSKTLRNAEAQYNLIGRSICPDKGLIGENSFLGAPMLNAEALKKASPSPIYTALCSHTLFNAKAFNSEESYEKQIKLENENKVGMNFNFKIFSIGATNRFKQVFKRTSMYSSKEVFAIAEIEHLEKRHTLQESSLTQKYIGTRFLDPFFLSNLYNVPMRELFRNYSEYFIADYYTGGKASILFRAQEKEKTEDGQYFLENFCSASFGFTSGDNTISGDKSIQFNTSGTEKLSQHFSAIEMSHCYYGGRNASVGFNTAKNAMEQRIDFSPWLSSFSDPTTHVFTSFNRLSPIHQYIREENLRKRIEKRAFGTKFYEPKIYISIGKYVLPWQVTTHITSEDFKKPGPIYVTLLTRYRDLIRLRPINKKDPKFWYAHSKEDFIKKTGILTQYLKKFYDVDIIRVGSYKSIFNFNKTNQKKSTVSVGLPDDLWTEDSFPANIEIEFYGLNEGRFQKASHPSYEGFELLLDKRERLAYVICDDYILDTYGLRKTFNNASKTTITALELYSYRLIGL